MSDADSGDSVADDADTLLGTTAGKLAPGGIRQNETGDGTDGGESQEAAESTACSNRGGSGSVSMGESQTDTKSTTATATTPTIASATLNASMRAGTTTTTSDSEKTTDLLTAKSGGDVSDAASIARLLPFSDGPPEPAKATVSPAPPPTSLNGEQKGSPARVFYTPKASRAERTCGGTVENKHPTVKPVALMEYLCKLTMTPTGGVVLDPFMGSGTTGVACKRLGRPFIGIEQDAESFVTARARITAT